MENETIHYNGENRVVLQRENGCVYLKDIGWIPEPKKELQGMTKPEYFEFAKAFYAACLEISQKKNADYTGKNQDPFSNFASVEVLGISTEQGFLTRMMDKMKRIASFVEQGTLQVKDESVTDTLRDLANYSCLFAGFIQSKKQKQS